MTSSPITSWQNRRGKKWKKWQISSSWALKSLWMVTVAMKSEDNCFSAGKRWQTQTACWKADITLPTKGHVVKVIVFPRHIRLWELGHKEGRAPRIDAFRLWCWGRLLRIPLIARRSNQSILKEISPEKSLKDWCWNWSSNILVT